MTNQSRALFGPLVGVLSLLVGACASPMIPEITRKIDERHIYLKNYEVDTPSEVNVGVAMIQVKDYWIEISEAPFASPTGPVNLSAVDVSASLHAGRRYPIIGNIEFNGERYDVVVTDDGPGLQGIRWGVLMKKDGSVHDRVVGISPNLSGPIVNAWTMEISDPSVVLVREQVETVKSAAGYTNFELIYTGIGRDTLNLTYREFSPEGLARVAFFQNLTYDASAEFITFKTLRIRILDADSERIRFVVVSDGTEE